MRVSALVGLLIMGLGLLPACSLINGQDQKGQEAVSAPGTEEERKIAEAGNKFGFHMLGELARDPGKNAFISPTSISAALAMTWNGAGGETAAEMARTLGLAGMEKETVNKGFRNLLDGLGKSGPNVEVNVANALWARQGGAFHPVFLQTVQENYLAEASQLNFADSVAAAGRINGWIKEKTKDKIDKILQPTDVDGSTDAVLTNAIYFKGQWTRPFDPRATFPGEFTMADGTKKQVPMMRQRSLPIRMLQTPKFEAAALPYGNGRFQLYVFLPARDSGLKEFLSSVSAEKWREWMSGFREERKTVILPRFQV